MAKERDNELKYQVPKHTSFVGSIIKVGLGTCWNLECGYQIKPHGEILGQQKGDIIYGFFRGGVVL